MTPKELFTRLKTHLEELEHSVTSNKVLNQVKVVPYFPVEGMENWASPVCFIVEQGATQYPENPELMEQFFSIAFFLKNEQDQTGEGLMLSRNNVANSSKNIGILDLEELVIDSLKDITELSSAKILMVSKNKSKSKRVKNNNPGLWRVLNFSALVSYSSDPDEEEILRVPGFLYVDPVDLVSSFGTKLGFVQDGVRIYSNYSYADLSEEEKGIEPDKRIYLGSNFKLEANLLNWNNEVISNLFPGLNSTNKMNYPNTLVAGERLDENFTKRVLFVPDDTDNNPILLMQKAMPSSSGAYSFRRGQNTILQVNFHALRKTSDVDGSTYIGPLSGATLR